MANFRLQVKKFEDKFTEKSKRLYQREARNLLYSLVDETPVQTGRLKANWRVGVGKVNTYYDKDRFSPKGSVPRREGSKIISYLNVGQPVYITNRTPYAAYVNYGTSKMEPRRFVEKALAKVK